MRLSVDSAKIGLLPRFLAMSLAPIVEGKRLVCSCLPAPRENQRRLPTCYVPN